MTATLAHLKYRPDIDGLRAVAVLSIVTYHAFPKVLVGGFTGVDIFFVISGFLISKIIITSLEDSAFTFREFYARRVRRIFPALILVLAASYVAGWFALLADEYKQLGKHIAGGAGFVANLVLKDEAGYFDQSGETKVLLHLWSLGVEEQFYILWPIILWLVWKAKRAAIPAVALLLAASLYWNVAGVRSDPTATFFSPHTRFWELLCGALLAWYSKIKEEAAGSGLPAPSGQGPTPSVGGLPANTLARMLPLAASLAGAALLVYGFYHIRQVKHYPGTWALVPVLGAALIIIGGPATWFNRNILSSKVAVWFGLISFPLYLWHWPLLVFSRIVVGGEPSPEVRLLAVAASIALAWLTYRFVERPIRQMPAAIDVRRWITPMLAVLMLTVGYIGYNAYVRNGLEFRLPKIANELTRYNNEHHYTWREGSCFLMFDQDQHAFANCPPETPGHRDVLLLWGDSHAAHLYPGLKARYSDRYDIVQRTASACPPLLDTDFPGMAQCRSVNDFVLAQIRDLKPARLIIAARWSLYDQQLLDGTLARLRAAGIANVEVVGPVPLWIDGLPKRLYSYYQTHVPHVIPYRMRYGLMPGLDESDRVIRDQALGRGAGYISPKDILCDGEGCLTRLGETAETLISFDYGHLTTAGSVYLVSRFPEPPAVATAGSGRTRQARANLANQPSNDPPRL